MSERARLTGDTAGDDPTSQERRAAVAARLRGLIDYPIGIKTRTPSLPGVAYHKPWPGDPNQQPYALLANPMKVSINDRGGVADVNGDRMGITVRPRHYEGRFELDLSQIESAFVDHRRGYAMPVHGSLVLPIGLTKHDGLSVLRWPSGITERDTQERAEVTTHPYHPGITVTNFYNADGQTLADGSVARLSLEEAKERATTVGTLTRTILLSHIDGGEVYVATSRLGYRDQASVTVRRPRESDEPRLHIEMVDYPAKASDDALLESHLSRYEEWASRVNGYASFPARAQRQPDIDSTLTYMMHD